MFFLLSRPSQILPALFIEIYRTKSSIVKAKPPIPENTFIFSCFLFRPDVPSLNSVGLLKHDYVIVTVENSELIAVCAGSITNISEEEVVLLTER